MVLEQVGDGYLVTDPDGDIVEANAAAAALLGIAPLALEGTSLLAYLAPEGAALVAEWIAELREGLSPPGEGAIPLTALVRLAPLNGEGNGTLPGVHVTAVPEHDPEVGLMRIHWLVRTSPIEVSAAQPATSPVQADPHEVPERLRVEARRTRALMETQARLLSEARNLTHEGARIVTDSGRHYAQALSHNTGFLEHLTQTAEIGIVMLSAPDYRCLYANPFFARLVGVDDQWILGRRVTDFLADQAGNDIVAMLTRARETGKALHIHEYEAVMRPGQPATFWDVEVLPLAETEGGPVTQLVVVGHEITLQVRGRREAAHLAAQSEAILGSLVEGVIVSDLEGRLVALNPAARGYLGLSEEDAAPATWAEITAAYRVVDLTGGALPPEEWPIARLLRQGGPLSGVVLRVIELEGGHEWIASYSGSLVRDSTGTPYLAVLAFRNITARVNAERERARLYEALDAESSRLEIERARLRAILNALPVGVLITDAEGRVIEGNSSIDTIMGGVPPLVEREAGPGGLWHMKEVPLPTRDRALALALRQGETTQSEEVEVRRLDGRRGVVLNATAPIVDADGMRIGAVAAIQDISELREARDALGQLAGRLEALRDMDRAVLEAVTIEEMAARALPWLQDALGSALVSLDLFDPAAGVIMAHTVIRPSPTNGARTVQQCHQAQLPFTGGYEALAMRDTIVVEDIEDAAGVGPVLEPIVALLRPGGVRAFTAVALATHDQLLGALVVGLDRPGRLGAEQLAIAQEVAAQFAVAIRQSQLRDEVREHAARMELRVVERTAELQASEARFRAIFEAAAVGIAVIDLGGYILQVNPAGQNMVGHGEDALIGLHFSAFTEPEKREREIVILEQLVSGELAGYHGEKVFRRADGRALRTRLAVSLVRDGGGAPSFVLGMVEDITAEREAQEALLRADKLTLTGQLAASLAHEIGNPLQTIIGCLGLARESLQEVDAETATRHMGMASGEAHRAAGIVRQLRDLNQPTQPQNRGPVDIAALVEKVLLLGEAEARHRDVEVEVIAPDHPLPMLVLVADQLHQVFLNLMLNALEAMPEGGRLEVTFEHTQAPAGVAVLFRDTGIGIPDTIQEHIFEPFLTTKKEGLGLGLYVTRGIVETHGGRIEVQSVVGEGSLFRVWLPE